MDQHAAVVHTGPSHHFCSRSLKGVWAVTAGEKHYTGLRTAEHTSWELPKGRHRHYTIKSTIHSDRKEIQS